MSYFRFPTNRRNIRNVWACPEVGISSCFPLHSTRKLNHLSSLDNHSPIFSMRAAGVLKNPSYFTSLALSLLPLLLFTVLQDSIGLFAKSLYRILSLLKDPYWVYRITEAAIMKARSKRYARAVDYLLRMHC